LGGGGGGTSGAANESSLCGVSSGVTSVQSNFDIDSYHLGMNNNHGTSNGNRSGYIHGSGSQFYSADESAEHHRDRDPESDELHKALDRGWKSKKSILQALWFTTVPRELHEDLTDFGVHVSMNVILFYLVLS